MSAIDINLFAGGGGLAIGLKRAGFNPDRLYELNPDACQTLRHNELGNDKLYDTPVIQCDLKDSQTRQDIKALDKPVRLLAGGVPCQPFSLGGNHKAQRDKRNLFPEFIRLAASLQPAAMLIENVQGLLRDSFKPYYQYLLRWLECPVLLPKNSEDWRAHNVRLRDHIESENYSPQYDVSDKLLNAADYGVPQRRRRVFIVAVKSKLSGHYQFPEPTHSKSSLQREQATGEYWEKRGLEKPEELPGRGSWDGTSCDGLKPWVTVRDAISDLPEAAMEREKAEMNHWLIPGAKTYRGHTGSHMDWPSKTIKAGVHGVPGGENTVITDSSGAVRYYTLREAARIQSFPDDHIFLGSRTSITRQIGNAIPPKLAAIVAEPLVQLVNRECEHTNKASEEK